MGDFDTVLERLVTDPAFAAALRADPGTALAGYQLTTDEVALLHTQTGAEAGGGTAAVETRANQSSAFGLLSPLTNMFGGFGGIGAAAGAIEDALGLSPGASGPGEPSATSGLGPAGAGSGGSAETEVSVSGFGAAEASASGSSTAEASASGSGTADASVSGFGPAGGAVSGFGPAGAMPDNPNSGGGGTLGAYGALIGDLLQPGDAAAPPEPSAGLGPAAAPQGSSVPEGYRTRVDVDGDGQWDRHIVRGRADGGVDILVDRDGDGRVDFVGRDDDADGRVDSAAYDTNGDGFFDEIHYDDDGDGLLDRSVSREPSIEPTAGSRPTGPTGGGALGGNLRLPEELR
jgi:hypothetical protein